MENKKFSMLNTAKKDTTTHETLQQEILNKRGGRPKKEESSKLKHVVSLNVNEREIEIGRAHV